MTANSLHLCSTFVIYSLFCCPLPWRKETPSSPELAALSPVCLSEVTSRTGHYCPKCCLHTLQDNLCPRRLKIQLCDSNTSSTLRIRSRAHDPNKRTREVRWNSDLPRLWARLSKADTQGCCCVSPTWHLSVPRQVN